MKAFIDIEFDVTETSFEEKDLQVNSISIQGVRTMKNQQQYFQSQQ